MKSQKQFLPHCAITCSECGGVMNRKGVADDIGGMSPFLYRKAATFDTSIAAREFAGRHGWQCHPEQNIDRCPACAQKSYDAVAAEGMVSRA